ncbi:Xaa-Pro peptidase family protein [uncultured Serinicoccus sp.]|uniref:M24 family metallopeptidase n=1 Tax=uncultured Serinicoccus sp. TaxID=735514 RepID=UPI00263714B7|nr:Xaa-Pro peptidase family protein [uncultured Serinicoccus sp.]
MTLSHRLPRSFYDQLHARLRDRLHQSGLDAILVDDWRDVAYLCGFFHHPNERPGAVWISGDRVVLLVPELEREHALAQGAAVDEVVAFAEFPGRESPFQVLARTVGTHGRWGHSPTLSTGRLAELQEVFDGVTWTMSGVVDALRLIKQPEEVVLHRAAAQLGDVMLTAGRSLIEAALEEDDPLPTESQLADHVVREGARWMYSTHDDIVVVPMLTGGLVYAGENTAFPHGLPSKTRLEKGDTVILSLGGAVGGRYAESERTFFIGEPSTEQLRYFTTDHRAQEVGTQAIRPGVSCREVNEQCLDVIRDAGLAEFIRHRQGHGIGLNFHEAPWLEDGDTTEIQPGMVLSSEPGIYVPGHAGYRISDTVLVTEDGHERLTTYPRDLDDIIIAA